jgi:outer membrane receptor for ferrienterochelin and colicin
MGMILIAAAVGLVVASGFVLSQLMSVGHTAYNNDSRGIFVQDAIDWKDLGITVGVRYDDHETFGAAVSSPSGP